MQQRMETQENSEKTILQNQETIWSAILHSVRIVFIQYQFVFYILIFLSVVFVPLGNLIQIYIEMSGHTTPWYLHICGGMEIELAVMVIFMTVGNYNILSRDEISMYPGNVISRYAGIVLFFHFMIIVSVLASVVGYLLQGILLTGVSQICDRAVLGNSVNLSYLWHGAVRYLGLLLAIYAIEVFWFVLTERLNLVLCYFFVLMLAAVVVILGIRTDILQILRDFFLGQGYSYAALLAVLFGAWVVFLLLSYCLAVRVKFWKAADKKRLGVAVFLTYLVFIGRVWIRFAVGDGYEYSMDPSVFQRESHQQVEVVADISAWEEKDIALLPEYDMSVKYRENMEKSSTFRSEVFASISCSASEAKNYGLSFDESKLDQDHIVLLLGTRNLTFAGRDLGKDTLQAFRQSTKLLKNAMDEKYQQDHPEEEFEPDYCYQTEIINSPIILLNGLYGNLSTYLDDTTLYKEGNFWGSFEDITDFLLRVVIYPDEWKQKMVQE